MPKLKYVVTYMEGLRNARDLFPTVEIEDCVEAGCCDNCGEEEVELLRTEWGWTCAPCLRENISIDSDTNGGDPLC